MDWARAFRLAAFLMGSLRGDKAGVLATRLGSADVELVVSEDDGGSSPVIFRGSGIVGSELDCCICKMPCARRSTCPPRLGEDWLVADCGSGLRACD
jgi:hypothetical protein